MSSTHNRLKKAIDELLILQRGNSQISISDQEKYRLATVTLKILENQKIDNQEWETLKPYNPEDPKETEKRISDRRSDSAKNQIEDTLKLAQPLVDQINLSKKKIEKIQQEIRIKIADRLPAGGKGEICESCGKKFTTGEYKEHIKECKIRK